MDMKSLFTTGNITLENKEMIDFTLGMELDASRAPPKHLRPRRDVLGLILYAECQTCEQKGNRLIISARY
jgi:hypothetical protein